MLLTTNVTGQYSQAPPRRSRSTLWASIDVEWTKNYRIKNGNVPFCYSVVYVAIPNVGRPVIDDDLEFRYSSVYVDGPDETPALVASANEAVRAAFACADRVTGHQFTSDLAVLSRAAYHGGSNTGSHVGRDPLPDITAARTRWLDRRDSDIAARPIIDTRYDAGHLLQHRSRRLVDVCSELLLDVTQPELRSTSMTALHRAYLDTGDQQARERISVLNLRHSLSTALVALRATDQAWWPGTLNVNRLLSRGLDGAFAWLDDDRFTGLLDGRS